MQIPVLDDLSNPLLAQALQHKLDQKTKPLGSLGRLEALAVRIGLALQSEAPVLREPQLLVFAADHGLARRGVSAYPSDVEHFENVNDADGGTLHLIVHGPPTKSESHAE